MSRLIRTGLASLGLLAGAAQAGGTVEGRWLTDDRKAIVQIARCGRSLCGAIAKVLDTDPAVPTTDVHNPEAALRVRPIDGLPVLYDFTFRNGRWTGGAAYDPKSGRSYRASLDPVGSGSLRVTGCVLVFCRAKTWTRSP